MNLKSKNVKYRMTKLNYKITNDYQKVEITLNSCDAYFGCLYLGRGGQCFDDPKIRFKVCE